MKTDQIKIRTTTEFKQRVLQVANHRNLSISTLATIALENEMSRFSNNVTTKNHSCANNESCQQEER